MINKKKSNNNKSYMMSYQRGDLSGLTSTLASQQAQSLPRLPPGGTWLTRLTNTTLRLLACQSTGKT